ncbi:MAG: HNH endonuclease [Actinobacteria bacterium]|nr:HNH endonuclease [Actinomycetota bacterium]
MTTCAATLASVVDELVAESLGGLWPDQLQERYATTVREVQRLQGWLSQLAGQLQASTAGQLATDDGGTRSVAGWLAETGRSTPSVAGRELRVSEALRTLPAVVTAVLDGVLTQPQAAVLARLVGRIPEPELQASQAELVQVAEGLDPAQLASWVRHLIATHCEPALEQDAENGRARRHLQVSREPDGSLRGRFVLAAEDSEPFLTVLEPLARRQGTDDDRSAGQRRGDALVEMSEQVLRFGTLPEAGGQRPQLSYVLPADWAARQQGRLTCPTCSRCPEHRQPSFADTVTAGLPGHDGVPAEHACAVGAWTGPQTRARIETLLCQARVSRVLLDSLGQVVGLESLTDSVTASQRRALAARDLGCVARGCTRPPAFCDAHHLIPLAEAGPTALGNVVLLCRRHHVLWHLGTISHAACQFAGLGAE